MVGRAVAQVGDTPAQEIPLVALEPVRSVSIREVRPESVLYAVTVRGDEAGLRRAVAASGRLVPAGSTSSGPVFRYQP